MPEPRRRSRTRRPRYTAATADRHVLYQLAVQNVQTEIDFVDDTYRDLRGRRASRLREDFCGTANTACEWVRRRRTNTAVGLDLDQATLDWGLAHNVASLSPSQSKRIRLLRRDVCHGGRGTGSMDVILAMNFSYWAFFTRDLMRGYFDAVRRSLAAGGVFFLDFYGGWEASKIMTERRDIDGKFTYVWDQASLDPISNRMTCHIHFQFKDGSKMRRAFSYQWRLWSLPEIRELLDEAGFARSTVYWEGDDEDSDGGDGQFEPADSAENCPSFIAYIVAEK